VKRFSSGLFADNSLLSS